MSDSKENTPKTAAEPVLTSAAEDLAAPVAPAILVEQIMTSDVHCVLTDMTVRDAIQLLLQHRIAGAPVIDSNKKVMSVVSEGNLLKLASTVGMSKTIYQCLIKLTKTDKLITLQKKDTFMSVYRKFLTTQVHRIIVVDDRGRLEGIVSRSDVLRIIADQGSKEQSAQTAKAEPVKSPKVA
jgi:CBS-domain-containing membrane protein